jgi:copper resistance protein B
VNWERKTGDSAHLAREDGEAVSATSFVAGVRFWF